MLSKNKLGNNGSNLKLLEGKLLFCEKDKLYPNQKKTKMV
tara:strand:+ start:52 stop:171 length:120 start_codon:yes stop_codon:yes gene_type:complete